MTERLAFVQACLDRRTRIVDVCARFGISEKTGHKVLRRFRLEGVAGLDDRSHAPRQPVFAVAPAIAARIVALRRPLRARSAPPTHLADNPHHERSGPLPLRRVRVRPEIADERTGRP
jgi:transposase-like protein